MKQLLFLFLFPCLALAQYPGNAGQKITLGEQTSADGLVYRGLAADTTRKPSVDTMAYILLDTNTNIIWQYKKATSNAWTRVGGSISSGVTGTLPVANGGTGADMSSLPNNFLVRKNSSGVFDTSAIFEAGGNVGIGTASPSNPLSVVSSGGSFLIDNNGQFTTKQNLDVATSGARWTAQSTRGTLGRIQIEQVATNVDGGQIIFETSPSGSTTTTERLRISQNGFVGIGTNNPQFGLDVRSSQGTIYLQSTTGTNDVYLRTANTGGDGFFGLESSTGGNVVLNGTPYSLVISHNSARSIHLGTNNTVRLTVNSIGDVGIGTTSPAVQFHTTGGVRFAGLASITDLRTDADGDLFNGSDFNLKNSIDTINFGLSDVLKLKPVSFNWNNEARNINEYKSMGFIAQDVMNVIPNAASTMGDGDMQVDYNAIVATLTKAIQEQQAFIKALEQRILILENK